MLRHFPHAVVLLAAALASAQTLQDGAAQPPAAERGFTTRSANLHRVKELFTGDVRVIWIGDSWSLMDNTARLPYGSVLVWPIEQFRAIGSGFQAWGPTPSADYTFGPGRLELVDSSHGWVAETNDGVPARIALPVNSISRVIGDPNLLLDADWLGPPRIQSHTVRNGLIALGDLPLFSGPDDFVRVRPLFYCPLVPNELASSISLHNQDATPLGIVHPRVDARPFWHLGQNPDTDPAAAPVASQINAVHADYSVAPAQGDGPTLVVCEDPGDPFVGSGDYWFSAGSVFYRADSLGNRLPGYYHGGLSTTSWQFSDFATNAQSNGNKRFTDEQLLHWLDVTTLDRAQQPIVILHIATEDLSEISVRGRVLEIMGRFRTAFGQIGALPPKFLLIGSFMHRIGLVHPPTDAGYSEALNRAMLGLAQDDQDCAFVSLYAMTDGTYFTSDSRGGAGTQQAARDWLDNNGWSTITYGGASHNLSSSQNGGLDGVLSSDGLHIDATPAAAFFAKLIAEEILASECVADANADGVVDTRDFIAFLQIWSEDDPAADIDGNGVVDTRDFVAFLAAWAQGC